MAWPSMPPIMNASLQWLTSEPEVELRVWMKALRLCSVLLVLHSSVTRRLYSLVAAWVAPAAALLSTAVTIQSRSFVGVTPEYRQFLKHSWSWRGFLPGFDPNLSPLFLAYGPQLGARLNLTHTQINIVGLAGNSMCTPYHHPIASHIAWN